LAPANSACSSAQAAWARSTNDRDLRERFEREARAVATSNPPHICVLHDVDNQDGLDFLVMEHFEGERLAARLAKGRRT
jgi:eukaryotic-like serine/threonine-protein kinase